MSSPNRNFTSLPRQAVTQTVSFMNRVYLWMVAGVGVSGLTAFFIASRPELALAIAQNKAIFWGLIIAQLVAVVVLSGMVQRISAAAAAAVFLGYATLVGATFSVLLFAYTLSSISTAFFTTAFSFAGLSIVGYTTKRDLGPVGSFCIMGLFGAIGFSILGFFMPSIMSNTAQLTLSVVCIIVFAGLTAYDTQRIKAMQYQYATEEEAKKGAIYGALILYLDFINLFLNILRLMGNRR